MAHRHMSPADSANRAKETRRANQRTALILLSIAAVFFGGIIVAQLGGAGGTNGIGVLGLAIVGFLVVAVGSHLRK
jgi:hypothetical protein